MRTALIAAALGWSAATWLVLRCFRATQAAGDGWKVDEPCAVLAASEPHDPETCDACQWAAEMQERTR